jgi:SAM-dependent methyltransferase
MVSSEVFSQFAPFYEIHGAKILDLGCGNAQPFGTSAVMFLNGASECIALDISETVPARAAVTLYDILADCIMFPDRWHWSSISRQEFLKRAYSFDLVALREGNLAKGTANIPIQHVVCDISLFDRPNESIDVLSSRVVLEHVMDFAKATQKMFSLLTPGGIMSHKIDLSDHRKKRGMHAFSFLADENWKGDTNRLRSSQIKDHFVHAGFEVLMFEELRTPMPNGFQERLIDQFKAMPLDDLTVTEINCILKRPA